MNDGLRGILSLIVLTLILSLLMLGALVALTGWPL